MIRSKREIEIFKQGKWITVTAIITEGLLCKYPKCNRKPPGAHNHTDYCSHKCAGKHLRMRHKQEAVTKAKNKLNKQLTFNKVQR